MGKIFITGSSDGIGSLAARALVKKGHHVTLHARNEQRGKDAEAACPGADGTLICDLSSTEAVQNLAKELNSKGPWDAIIHNAGVMHGVSGKTGPEGVPLLFATNTLAPYMLACLVRPPAKRMVFLSSQLHSGGDGTLRDIKNCGYGDSKLHNTMMAFAFSKIYKDCEINSVDPGWVQTKMGGSGASDDIQQSVGTYVKLAEGCGETGQHFYDSSSSSRKAKSVAYDEGQQKKLLDELAEISGVPVPK